MGLKGDLIKVGFSNLIVLFSSLINGFVLPMFLSIKGYADYKTYVLYASFIGFLHFGFVDGINIKYGGKNKKDINTVEFKDYHTFFAIFQIIITIFLLVIGIIIRDKLLFFFCLAIFPVNILSFFSFFFQAIGEFRLYTIFTIIVPICNILTTLLLLFFNIVKYELFIISNILSYTIAMILLELLYLKQFNTFKFKQTNYKQLIFNTYKILIIGCTKHYNIFVSGFFIMLGTVAFNLFFDIGRWMTKILTDDVNFAMYSLSLSLIGFIVIFVSAVNKTFYPYIHRNRSFEVLSRLRRILYITSSISIPAFFILHFFINKYLPEYSTALPITAIVITSVPGIFIIKSIYANLYKIERKESQFLIDTSIFLLIGLGLNVSLYLFFKTLTSIAIASVITIYIWTLFPRSFIVLTNRTRIIEFFYILSIMLCFYIIYYFKLDFVISTILSLILILIINYTFYNKTLISLIKR